MSRLYQDAPINGSIFAIGYYDITLVIDTSVLFPQDEAFVVPALQRLGGEASVTDNGNLLYTFPKLQRTAGQRSISSSETSTSFERVLPCDESDTPALESPTQDALGTGGWAGSMFRRAGAVLHFVSVCFENFLSSFLRFVLRFFFLRL